MSDYRVTWQIDVEADDPVSAAREAQRMQRDHKGADWSFDVTDKDGRTTTVDLEELGQRDLIERPEGFNPALAQWLDDHGLFVSDWPHAIGSEALAEASATVGGGEFLDDLGWTARGPSAGRRRAPAPAVPEAEPCDYCGKPKATPVDGEMLIGDPRIDGLCWAKADDGEMCSAEENLRKSEAALRRGNPVNASRFDEDHKDRS